jgi:hypothetical protein
MNDELKKNWEGSGLDLIQVLLRHLGKPRETSVRRGKPRETSVRRGKPRETSERRGKP